jgi:hypothetical protein
LAVTSHAPVPILTSEPGSPEFTITVDASEDGWGAIVVNNETSATRFYAVPWTDDERESLPLWSSVVAEPLAIVRAAVASIPIHCGNVLVCTDHLPMVYAGKRGYAACRAYNDCLCRLAALFPACRFTFRFVPGSLNAADPFSRGQFGWYAHEPQVKIGFLPSIKIGG